MEGGDKASTVIADSIGGYLSGVVYGVLTAFSRQAYYDRLLARPEYNSAEHRGQTAERITEPHRPRTNIGGEQFALVRVIAEAQPGVAEGNHHPAENQP